MLSPLYRGRRFGPVAQDRRRLNNAEGRLREPPPRARAAVTRRSRRPGGFRMSLVRSEMATWTGTFILLAAHPSGRRGRSMLLWPARAWACAPGALTAWRARLVMKVYRRRNLVVRVRPACRGPPGAFLGRQRSGRMVAPARAALVARRPSRIPREKSSRVRSQSQGTAWALATAYSDAA